MDKYPNVSLELVAVPDGGCFDLLYHTSVCIGFARQSSVLTIYIFRIKGLYFWIKEKRSTNGSSIRQGFLVAEDGWWVTEKGGRILQNRKKTHIY